MNADEISRKLRAWKGMVQTPGVEPLMMKAADEINHLKAEIFGQADLIESLQTENKALREASRKVLEGLQKLDSAIDNATCDGDALKARAEEAERREQAAVELVSKLEQALQVIFGASDYIKPNTGVWHTTGLALDWIKEWRGPQETGEEETR